MFGDIFGKLNEMKQKVEDVKAQLDTVSVAGESPDGRIKIVANGNKVIKSVDIDESLRTGDPEELEDQLILAINLLIRPKTYITPPCRELPATSFLLT